MGRRGLLSQILAATWLIAATAWAQTAQIQGRLVDAQGGVIPGAQVSALDEEKGVIARETTSGSDGFFTLPSLDCFAIDLPRGAINSGDGSASKEGGLVAAYRRRFRPR